MKHKFYVALKVSPLFLMVSGKRTWGTD